MELKWSQFVFWVELRNKKEVIARNTLTTSTVRMTNKIKDMIDSTIHRNQEINALPISVREYIQKLIQLEILVPLELDEKEKYLKLFHKARVDDKTFGIYLVTTRNCQLNCPYCFERTIERKGWLKSEIVEQIVLWCQNYLNRHRDCNKFRVVLYGGEPLLSKRSIKSILPRLYNIARERGLLFELGILTNGELLDLETLSFLNHYNLDRVQITLDGPKEIHDKRRIRKDGKDGKETFDRIIQNILMGFQQNLLKKVYLRINFDRQNVDSIPALFDFLIAHDLQQKLELSFGIVTPTICEETGQRVSDTYFTKFGLSQNENATKYLWLWQEAKKRGFTIPQEYLAGPWCTARKIHSAVIEPDGTLLKCISTVGRKEFAFGDIFSVSEAYDPNFSDFSYLKECLSKGCPFVPICGGGCRFEAYLSSGSLSKPHCQRELIEKINKELVQLNFG